MPLWIAKIQGHMHRSKGSCENLRWKPYYSIWTEMLNIKLCFHNIPLQFLEHLQRIIQWNRQSLRTRILNVHDDNAPSHTALCVREFWAENQTPEFERPLCSPNLFRCYRFSYSQKCKCHRSFLLLNLLLWPQCWNEFKDVICRKLSMVARDPGICLIRTTVLRSLCHALTSQWEN
jgi:hypothetical protein